MFRKTKATYDQEDFVKRFGKKQGEENAIILSDHEEIGTARNTTEKYQTTNERN